MQNRKKRNSIFTTFCTACKKFKNHIANFFFENESDKKTLPVTEEDEDFISDSKAALLNRITPTANKIIYVVALFLIACLIWSYFAEIDQSTSGEGRVIPSSEVKVIQSLDGGVLEKILVTDGEFVKKGQPLILLDPTRFSADYAQAYKRYLALVAAVARLTAESQGKQQMDIPSVVSRDEPELVEREKNLFNVHKKQLADQLAVSQTSYDLAAKNVSMLAPLAKKGIVAQIDLIKAQRDANEAKGRIQDIQEKFRENSLQDLNQRKADLQVLTENLISLRDKMVDTRIKSPVDGIVKKINVHTIGGVIQPAMNIMEIVPIEDTLLVEAKILPSDIAFIKVGALANVRLTAYDYSRYGLLKGHVEYISPDAIEENKTPTGTVLSYYIIHVRTQQNYIQHGKEKYPIIPGMTASVQIKTGSRTILQYILKPLLKAKQEAFREK